MKIVRTKPKFIHQTTNRIKSLRQGQTVYVILSLGQRSYLAKYLVNNKAKVHTSISFFDDGSKGFASEFACISLKAQGKYGGYITDNSLMDMNVIPNSYNDHRLFTSRSKAENYLKLCLQGTVAYTPHEDNYGWEY